MSEDNYEKCCKISEDFVIDIDFVWKTVSSQGDGLDLESKVAKKYFQHI